MKRDINKNKNAKKKTDKHRKYQNKIQTRKHKNTYIKNKHDFNIYCQTPKNKIKNNTSNKPIIQNINKTLITKEKTKMQNVKSTKKNEKNNGTTNKWKQSIFKK